MIRVLVVDDSAVSLELLVQILNSDPNLRVVGTAVNGEQALAAVARHRPDVITMDLHMPKMNGFDATRRIMETHPTPVVIVCGSSIPEDVETTFRALEAGALAVVRRPPGLSHPKHAAEVAELVQSVKLMSEVKVVRRWSRGRGMRRAETAAPAVPAGLTLEWPTRNVEIIAIGASTGGPPVLQAILSALPASLGAPVLIVQHMATGFVQGFVDWLSPTSSLPVHLAGQGTEIHPGHVYVAPDGFHLKVGQKGRAVLSSHEPEHGLRPSVSFLLRSVAQVYGADAAGVLLTGMGTDGAAELKLMREKGAVTIAQDKESSVVHGMPGEAIELDAAEFVLSPRQISALLARLGGQKGGRP